MLLDPGGVVGLVLLALAQQRRQGFGAAVDLDKPAVLVLPARDDRAQVGLEVTCLPAGAGVAPPRQGLDQHGDRLDIFLTTVLDALVAPWLIARTRRQRADGEMCLGHEQAVVKEPWGRLTGAVALFVPQQPGSGTSDLPHRLAAPGTQSADASTEGREHAVSPKPGEYPASGALAGGQGAQVGEGEKLYLDGREVAMLGYQADDPPISFRQPRPNPLPLP